MSKSNEEFEGRKKIEGTLLNTDYFLREGKAVIELFFWTDAGKIRIEDDNFEPYLLVEIKDNERIEGIVKELEKIRNDEKNKEHYVTKCEFVKRRIGLENKEFIKVIVNRPSSVPALKGIIRKTKGVKEIYEYDIPFAFRYLLDKGLSCFNDYSVSVEEKNERLMLKRIQEINALNSAERRMPNAIGIDIETFVSNEDEIKPEKDPILMISIYGEKLKKILIAGSGKDTEMIEWCGNEKAMLERLFEIINAEQPAIIFGYNSDSFDMSYIARRTELLGIKHNEIEFKDSSKGMPVVKIKGYAHIDLYRYIRIAGGRGLNLENYSLDEVANKIIGKGKNDLNPLELSNAWRENNEKKIIEFAIYNLNDAEITYELGERFLPSISELSRLICLSPEDVCRMSFSQLVEWYLMKRASQEKAIIPNKPESEESYERRKRRFEGAFVFQPTPGLYDNIVVFDFRSLYPSIIASHNISTETFTNKECEDCYTVPDKNQGGFIKKPTGLVSKSIKDILKQRREVKARLKKDLDEHEKSLLKAREQGLKTLANSMYGYLAYERARWYCYECARAVASFARYYIKDVISKANKEGFHVIYSDTDSIFITLKDKTKEECILFVEQINKELPEEMELEYEGFYKRGIFVFAKSFDKGAKKRYALIDEDGDINIKGFEVIRRNWSEIGKRIQMGVLRRMLEKGNPEEALDYLKEEIEKIRKGEVDFKELEIRTKITKNINSYANISPHVAAAKRAIEKRGKIGAGSIISYIVAKSKTGKNERISERVILPEECTKDSYDENYYIEKQIIPAVESIFKTVGIDIENALKSKESQQTLLGFYSD
ncbi:MAG: polymerase, archaea type [Candidatus Woesearchaeota archaeon]|nr:polymerase, archaea type [Candidatus Woesearchaeota archaeon]